MCRRRRHNRGEVRRQFLSRCPLIESGVGTAPHRDFAVTKRLFREPFHYVITITRVVGERLEVAAGIPASAYIDQGKGVAMGSGVGRARMLTVGDVRREGENDWSPASRCVR